MKTYNRMCNKHAFMSAGSKLKSHSKISDIKASQYEYLCKEYINLVKGKVPINAICTRVKVESYFLFAIDAMMHSCYARALSYDRV